MEPRVLFSATALEPVDEGAESHHLPPAPTLEQRVIEEEQEAGSGEEMPIETANAILTDLNFHAADIEGSERREIVFISTTVENYEHLLEHLDPAYEVFLIDGSSDGVGQIASALEGMSGIDAIHLIGHGEEGRLYLGETALDATSMTGQHRASLEAIGQSLSPDADLLIYGCEFTSGDDGLAAASLLGDLTGADVAASVDGTGHVDLGGDWDLETEIGQIDSVGLAVSTWNGLLAPISITNTSNATTLANNIIGSGISLVSATYTGDTTQAGTFTSATGYTPEWLAYSSGIILTTGNTNQIQGANTTGGATVDAPPAGSDADLAALGGGTSFDASVLNFTFVPTSNRITMQFTFGSDEYAEYVYSAFNDVMGVWVNGTQVALTMDNRPISVNAINQAGTLNPAQGNQANDPDPSNGIFDSSNPNLYVDNDPTGPTYNTGMDGFTVTLSFVANVNIGVNNTIKIGITDIGDAGYDSWLFIREDSLTATTIAANDFAATAPNTPVVINALGNDTDSNGLPLTITHVLDKPIVAGGAAVTLPSGSTVALNLNGTLTFTPIAGSTTDEVFTYTISNGNGTTAVGNVLVDINQTPSNTVAAAQTTNEDTARVITGVSVADVDSTNLTTTLSIPAGVGTLSVVTGGGATITNNGTATVTIAGTAAQINAALASITYTPTADYNTGSPATPFNLTVATSDGVSTDSDTIAITVNPVTDIVADTVTTNEDQAVTFNVITGTNGASADNFENGGRAVTGVTQGANGTVTFLANGSITYTPNANFHGSDSFTYTVTSGGVTETATVNVTISPINDAPTNVVPGAQATNEDTNRIITGVSVADVDGGTLTTTLSIPVGAGTLSVVTGGGATITNNGTAVVTIVGTATQINAALASITYVPTADYNTGTPATPFNLTVLTSDGSLNASNTIAITVNPVTDIVADAVTTNEDQAVAFNALTGTNGASADNFENAGRSVTSVTQGANGTVTFLANGTLTYTPNANFHGTDSFTYTVTSGGVTETATVNVTISPINDAPTNVVPGAQSTNEDTNRIITGVSVADVDGGSLTTTLSIPAGAGTLSVVTGGGATITNNGTATVTIVGTATQINAALASITYVPTADYNTGTPATPFNLTVLTSDGSLNASNTVAITVNPVTDIVADAVTTNEDQAVTFNVITGTNGASADSFENGGRAVTAVTQGSNGTVSFLANGSITYTPNANFHGTDSFTYTVTSGGVTETATVNVTISPINDAPTNVVPGAQSTNEDTNRIITGVSVADVDGGSLTTTLSIPAGAGTLSVVTGGGATITNNGTATVTIVGTTTQINAALASITYVPTADYNTGTPATPFNLTVLTSDGSLNASNTVAITVNPVTDIVADAVTTNEDQAVAFNALTGTNGASADSFENAGRSVTSVTQGSNGTVSFLANGSITYTPNANFHGTDSFTYTVTSGGVTETATVNVTISSVNDAPVTVGSIGAQGAPDGTTIAPLNVTGFFNDVDGDSLTYSASNLPPGLTIHPTTGLITGTITTSASVGGPYTVVVTAEDPSGALVTQTFVWTVTNPAPVAVNDSFGVDEGDVSALLGNVMGNDSDPDGDTLTVVAQTDVAGSQGGLFTIDTAGNVVFDPNGDFEGLAEGETRQTTFVYSLVDADGATSTATVTVTVTGENDVPVAVGTLSDQTSDDGDSIAPWDVSSFFDDADLSDSLTYSVTGLPPGLTLDSLTGVITGTIDVDASTGGPYFVQITATDPEGASVMQTFTWTVNNPAPVAQDDDFAVDEDDGPVLVGNAISNDSDPDGDSIEVQLQSGVAGSQGGLFSIDASGNVSFDPNGDFEDLAEGETRETSFTYTLVDADGATSMATVTVTVTGENDSPVTVGSILGQNHSDSEVVSLDVSGAFADPDSADVLTYSAGTTLPPGLTIDANTGVITGTLDSSASAGSPYVVVVTATDPLGATVSQSFTWTVVNPAPVGQNDQFGADEDDGAALVGNALGNDSDADGDVLSAVVQNGVSGSHGGLFSIDANGNVTFDANGDFEDLAEGETRETVFTYTVEDADGSTNTATVTVTVTGRNDAPVAVGSILNQTGNDSDIVNLVVSGAFGDPDTTDTLTYSVNGTLPPGLTIDGNTGVISGTLDSSASAGGPYTVVVTATDPEGATVTQTFTWTVNNPAPIAQDDVFVVNEDDAAATLGNAITGNDSDPDGDAFTAQVRSGVAGSQGGLFSIDANGNVTFDPDDDFEDLAEGETRQTSFTYTVEDADGSTDTATVTVTVTGQNDAPVAVGSIANQTGNDSEVVNLNVSSAFGDPDATDALTYSANGTLPPGLAIDANSGVISGTLDSSASEGGPYTVTITATDPEGATVMQIFSWTVNNPVPVAVNDGFNADEDDAAALVGNALTNDNDPDGDALTVLIQSGVSGSQGGLFSIDANGNVTFDPNGDFEGLAVGETRQTSFSYTVVDADGATSLATVTVTVTGMNDAPVTVGTIAHQSSDDGDAVNLDVSGAFDDVDLTDVLEFSATGLPGGLSIDQNTGIISGTIDSSASASGPYTVVVTAADGNGGTVNQTFTWTVGNPLPVAVDDSYSVDEDDAAAMIGNALLDNDSDPDDDALTVVVQSGAAGSNGGVFSIAANGEVTFDPDGDFEDLAEGETRTTTFTYTLVDADGASSTAVITVTMHGANDAPVASGVIPNQTGDDGDAVALDVSGAFADVDAGDSMTFSANGTLPPGLTIDANTGLITGTLDSSASVNGPYTVEITATDALGSSVTQIFTWTVNNPAPVAQDDLFGVTEDASANLVGNALGNDSDPDQDAIAAQPQTGAAGTNGGLFSILPNGDVTFDPNGDFEDLAEGETRETLFTYTLVDADGASSTATVTVTVTGRNDAPVAVGAIADRTSNDSDVVALDVSVAFNDVDATDVLTYSAGTTLPPGLTIDANTGIISGTLDVDASVGGPYVVTITATDSEEVVATQSFTWTVNNPAPVAVDDAFGAGEDDAVAIVGKAIANDGDPDGDSLSTEVRNGIAGSHGGVFSIDAAGNVTFHANGEFEGLAAGETRDTSFTYTLRDADGETSSATVTVTVTGQNDAPFAVGAITNQTSNDGEPISLDVSSAFGETDTTDALTYSANGTLPPGLMIDANTGIISGTLDSSASAGGPYLVEIAATDPAGVTVTQTFIWTVNNPAPIALGDQFGINEDAAISVMGNVITSNDTDSDGDELSAVVQNGAIGSHGGHFHIDASGNVSFDPHGDFEDLAEGETRETSFTYTLVDADGATSMATVTVTVTGENDSPVTVGSILGQNHSDSEVVSLDVSGAFADPDSADVLTYSAGTTLPPGLTIDANTGVITGTLDSSASAGSPYVVVVTATDPLGATVSQSFTWTVVNPAPVGQNDQFGADEDDGAALVGNALGNDSDADNDVLSAVVQNGVSGSHGGLFSIDANGNVTFDANGDFEDLAEGETRETVFTYTVEDADGSTNTATVTVTVTGRNDAPTTVGTIADRTSQDGEVVALDVRGGFADVDSSDVFVYSVNGTLPPGLAIDADTGIISGTITTSASAGGPYNVTVTATDPEGASVTQTFLWTVNNPSPLAVNDDFAALEDDVAAVMGNALGNDSDPDGDALSAFAQSGIAGSQGGIFSIDAAGNVTFDPNGEFEDLAEGETRQTTFSYTLEDADGSTGMATVTITVTGQNDAPVTVGSILNQTSNDSEIVNLNISSAFGDPDATDALTYSVNGTLPPGLTIDADTGVISGTLDASASAGGPYTVTVTASDPEGASVTQTFLWTVNNPAPMAVNDDFGADEEDPAAIVGNVLGNDGDPDGDALTTQVQNGVAGSQGGIFSIDANGNVSFDPAGDFEDLAEGEFRQTTFSYTLEDADGSTSMATVTVTVTGQNDAPVTVGSIADQTNNDSEVISLNVSGAFGDPDTTNSLTYSVNGTLPPGLTIDTDTGVISGTLDSSASAAGPYTVTVTATDPEGASVNQTFTWTVNNLAPIAQVDAFAADEDDVSAIVGNVVGNDSDPDGDALTTQVQIGVAGSQGGLFSIDANGNVTFDPNGDFEDLAEGEIRQTSFTYTLVDADGSTDTATVTVTVTGQNDAPVALGSILNQTSNDSEFVNLNVSSAFGDPDTTDILTYSANGTLPSGLMIDADTGVISGTLDSSASAGGPYTVTVTATDPEGAAVTQTFLWTVNNPAPLAVNDALVAEEDDVSTMVGNVLGNDSDPDGDALSAVAQSGAAGSQGGLFSIDANGNVTFDPDGDFEDLAEGETRQTSFTYTLIDADGATNTATVTVTVTGQNDTPVTVGSILSQTNDDGEVISLNVSSAFGDPDATDSLTYSVNGTLPPGLTIDADTGVISGTLDSSASAGGPYTVTVTATDPEGAAVTQTFLWTVNNPAPLAQDDAFAAHEDDADAIVGNALGNDSDPDGDSLSTQVRSGVAGSQGGLFSIDAAGNVTFDPNGDFEDLAEGETRQTSFTYTLIDADGETSTATVTVTVTGQNDAPVTVGSILSQTNNDSEVISLDVSGAFGDPDATDALSYSANGTLPPGLAIDANTGVISGTLDSSASAGGPYTVTVTAIDPEGATVTQTFSWTVNNPAPVAQDDGFGANEDAIATVVGNALANDLDADSDLLTAAVQNGVAGSGGGLFSIDANGDVTFHPNGQFEDLAHGETRTTSFQYSVIDADGATSTAIVTVTVTGQNDAPVVVGTIANQSSNDSDVVALDVSGAFADGDISDVLTFTATDLPAGLTIDADTGVISGTIDSSASASGPYTVIVTAHDDHGGTVTLGFLWTVTNPAPVAAHDAFTAQEDQGAIVVGNALANDGDADDDDLTAQGQTNVVGTNGGLFSLSSSGDVTFHANGGFEDLAAGETRQTSFTYTLVDADGATSTATITVTVNGQNDAPVSTVLIAGQTSNDSDAVILDVSGAFADPDTSDVLTYSVNGTLPPGLTIDANTGVISGTLDSSASAAGPYLVEVTATDGSGAAVMRAFLWTVGNPAPVAEDDDYSVHEDAVAAVVGNVLANDLDPDGDSLTAQILNGTPGSHGGLFSIDANGNVAFDPNGDFEDLAEGETRQTRFTYMAVDADGGTSEATVTVTVTGRNDAPESVGSIADRTSQDSEVVSLNVSAAFGDPDTTDVLIFSVNGTLPPGLTIDANTGVISGVLDSSASAGGPYHVVVTATDPEGASVTQSFLWTVDNPAPVAQDDSFTANAGDAAAPVGNAILNNDSDVDGDAMSTLVRTNVAGSQGGIFSIDANGNVTFDPNGAFEDLAATETRQTSFTYTLVDADGGTSTATVTVTVTGRNDAPVAVGVIAAQSHEDGDAVTLDISGAFTDPDGTDVLTYSANGTLPPGLTIDANSGVISGTLDSSASAGGPYTVTITATDLAGASVTQTFTWTVSNPGPGAQDDAFSALEDANAAVVGNVIGNDSDPDADVLNTQIQSAVSGDQGGLFSIDAAGNVTFAPNGDFEDLAAGETRQTSFTYTVVDADGATSTASVTVTVTGVNDAPVPVGSISGQTNNDSDSVTLDVSGAFGDPDASDGLTYNANGTLPTGLMIDTVSGIISGTLDSSASGNAPYLIQITAIDSQGATVTQTFLWTIKNPSPLAVDDTFAAGEDDGAAVVGNAIPGNDTDPDGDALTASTQVDVAGSHGGLFTIDLAGNVTFDPNGQFEDLAAGETRQTSFTYTLVDADGATSSATVTVTVTGANDAPAIVGAIPDQADKDSESVSIDVSSFFEDLDQSDDLVYAAAGLPAGLAIDPQTGVISGTLASNASVGGPYQIDITVVDGNGGSVAQSFTWVVSNPAPIAGDDFYTVGKDSGVVVVGNAITGNDLDPDGDGLSTQLPIGQGSPHAFDAVVMTGVAGSQGGTFAIDANGNITFDPGTDFDDLVGGQSRQTTFIYLLSDADGATSTGMVTVTVLAANTPPEADSGSLTVPIGSSGGKLGLQAPADPEGDVLTIRVSSLPKVGVLRLANGKPVQVGQFLSASQLEKLVYDAPASYKGKKPVFFRYLVSDGQFSTEAVVKIRIVKSKLIIRCKPGVTNSMPPSIADQPQKSAQKTSGGNKVTVQK